MTMRVCVVGMAALTLATGCTGDGGGGKSDPCDFQFGSGGAIAQFKEDPTCATNPWPEDRLLDAGRTAVPESRVSYTLPPGEEFDDARAYLQATADDLDSNGWSTIAPLHIVLDDEIDLATVVDGFQFFRFAGDLPIADATGFDASWDADLNALVLQPRTPFLEATSYGVVITADLLNTDARPTARGRGFQNYISGTPLARDLALYEGAGVQQDQIALTYTFTTGAQSIEMVAVRDLIFAAVDVHTPAYEIPSQLPGLTEGYFLSTSAQFTASLGTFSTGSNLAGVAVGSFDAWDFRGADGGAFDQNLVTGAATPPIERLDFRLTIPEGVPPANGWPVVIFGHGLGGQDTDVYRWGNTLAPRGFAVIGISAVNHGLRGFVSDFFNWESIPATRENFRQTTADHLQLLRMLQEGELDGLAPFNQLDVDEVSYFGISLGGIMGSSFLALSPDANSKGLLVVPGGHLARELYAEEVGTTYLHPFIANRAQIEADDPEFPLFLKGFEMLVQLGLDRVDPVNFATHIVAPGTQLPSGFPKRVLQTVSVGDNWVPNDANFALQSALGIPTLSAATTNTGGVSGAWQIDDADFPSVSADEPHSYFSLLCEAQEMGFHWLESDGTEVIDPTTVTCP